MSISIVNGRVIDPANHIDAQLDIHIAGNSIVALGAAPTNFQAQEIIDATGCIVCPGLVDIAVRSPYPGYPAKGSLASETAAAAKGGITTLICSPNTQPVIDTPAVVELIHRKARELAQARVLTTAALTRGLDGSQLSDMATLKKAGCVACSNADQPLANTLVERRALEYATTFNIPVFLRSEDRDLRAGGCVHEGATATRLGLPGIPTAAESVAVARDLALAEHTGARIHFRSLSAARSVRMVSEAQNNQLPISADVAAHQLHLTEMDVEGFDARCHVWPPLRTLADRDALRKAVADGSVQAICSDHQPHEDDAKEAPFAETAPGISGLESLLALTLKLVDEKVLSLSDAIARVTCGPADLLKLPYGRLNVGNTADICIFNPQTPWTLNANEMLSEGHNTPFDGWEFNGQVCYTLFNGQLVYKNA
jgi:dihydroorotase